MQHRTTGTTRTITALLISLMLMLTLGLSGCGTADEPADATETPSEAADSNAEDAASTFPVTVTDDAGREVTIDGEPTRIVSLAPANTEIVAELDGGIDRLVGVTTFDDYPPEVAQIDKIGDFITPNLEAIAAAEPDLILATTGVQGDVLAQLEELGAPVVAIDPQNLDQLFESIMIVGDAIGRSDEAAALTDDMLLGLDYIAETVAQEDATPCFIEIAQDPLFTAGSGTLLDDLIRVAGGRNVVTEAGYVGYSLEQLLFDDPDAYLATLGSMSDPSQLEERAGYAELSAVKNGRVAVLDDNLVSRPGPRVVQGVGQIAVALHPALFGDGAEIPE